MVENVLNVNKTPMSILIVHLSGVLQLYDWIITTRSVGVVHSINAAFRHWAFRVRYGDLRDFRFSKTRTIQYKHII